MITLQNTVKELLESTGAAVFYFHPQNWVQLPCISWRESMNRELKQAGGREHLAELEYTVDVWAKSPAEVAELAARVNAVLTAVRLRRDFSQDLFENGMHHRTMRYRCAADRAGRIYQ
ncbi:MAG: DUF3168 domain-containing protein [Clostridia bacterium]|nr:DUF3168 domain-containing protein [Clostridia bacterium]